MKWEQTRQYSPQEIQAMQQDAIERVRQMQQRSERVLRRSAKVPSFFIEEENSHPASNQEQNNHLAHTDSSSNMDSHHFPAADHHPPADHPSASYHSSFAAPTEVPQSSLEQILSALNLEKEQLLILALLFLLYTDGADQTLLLALLYLFL